MCSAGHPQTFECLNGLHWNQDIQDCDFPLNVECEVNKYHSVQNHQYNAFWCNFQINYPTTEDPPVESTTEPSPPECPSEQGVFMLPHPTSCSLFYICVGDGQPHLRECPDDLEFDSAVGECRRTELFECPNRLV